MLVPFLLELGSRTAAFVGPREVAYLTASFIYDGLALTAQMLALYGLTRQWFSPGQALVGVAFTTSATLATFGYFLYQPWSILEVMLFALGFWMAYRERWTAVAATVVLASLNRETGVFLPLALLLANLERADFRDLAGVRAALRRPAVLRAIGLVVLSTAIFVGLRLVRGGAPPVDQLAEVWSRNLDRNNLTAAGHGPGAVSGARLDLRGARLCPRAGLHPPRGAGDPLLPGGFRHLGLVARSPHPDHAVSNSGSATAGILLCPA